MGHRMELYIPEIIADSVVSLAGEYGIGARIIGHCEPCGSGKLTIRSPYGEFEW